MERLNLNYLTTINAVYTTEVDPEYNEKIKLDVYGDDLDNAFVFVAETRKFHEGVVGKLTLNYEEGIYNSMVAQEIMRYPGQYKRILFHMYLDLIDSEMTYDIIK